ncbi:MAG: phosphoenolpyruvate synthase, partial [Anaerolineaceae bacterium]|nr:phosphoenolpyruvate synthase [Anaerolineaceae bacterium]
AILIQVVQGEQFGKYYLPHAAGVAFSRNLYRWAPQIRREDGFIRLVWGLGTRAVDRVGNDYPRLIALSHPLLRPSTDPKNIRRYSQQYVDLLDLEDNTLKTLPVLDVLNSNYGPLRYIAQLEEEGYFRSLRSSIMDGDPRDLVLTFDELLRRSNFGERMRTILLLLEQAYRGPVDMEFTLNISPSVTDQPSVCLCILQCRPQAQLIDSGQVTMPMTLEKEDIVFSTNFMVPQGEIDRIEYVLFVPPEAYFALPTNSDRTELAHFIGRLNAKLEGKTFICVGPGRWGSSNADLGVPIAYGDIYHSRALVELAGQGIGPAPEPSLGTHFFQDLLESQIYPLAITMDEPKTIFNQDFFYGSENCVAEMIDIEQRFTETLKLIRVKEFRPGACMRLVMSDEKSQAVAFLEEETRNV